MSKNAKKQLKAILEKHKNDVPARPKKAILTKPTCVMIPLMDLDDCLEYAIQKKVISKNDADSLIYYMKTTSDPSGYWDLHWKDIEGIDLEYAEGFRDFYELFKEHETKTNLSYPHLHFEVGVYS